MLGRGNGPIPTRIMIVGEAWGEREEARGEPFVGASGEELNRMLHEAGIMRSECFVSNVVNARPPKNDIGAWMALKKKDITAAHIQLRDRFVLPIVKQGYEQLLTEIEACQPNVIVPVGNLALWALTGNWGILKWRGSMLDMTMTDHGVRTKPGQAVQFKVIPTIHPAAVLREWSQRSIVVNDLRRVKREMQSREYSSKPQWQFHIRPSFTQVLLAIGGLELALNSDVTQWNCWLDLDLETQAGHIACCGLSWSLTEAICIPFITRASQDGYWSEEEEAQIIWRLYRVLTHPKVKIRWQNGLYDAQYIHKWWHFIPNGCQDTMISQHSLFCALPKSLAFQASMYAKHYVFWKDEGKNLAKGGSEEEHWTYNLQDCVYTRECGEVELATAKQLGLTGPHDFQQKLFYPVLDAMLRGIRVRPEAKAQLSEEIQSEISRREAFLFDVLGHPLNPNSHPQMTKLFYEDLKQTPIMSRAKKNVPAHVTCDDEALQKISAREPLLKPIINAISDVRTLGIFQGMVLMKLDADGRARCSFNIGGSTAGKSAPYTFRLSSSKNAFDSGTNFQNIPSEKSKSIGKAAARGTTNLLDSFKMPNIRSLFGPELGCTFFDMDLDRADLQVFVWEIGDELYKELLRKNVDAHLFHVYLLDNKEPPPLDELVETHPKYPDHRGPRKHKREFAKVFCHATDYVGSPRTVAAHTGRTVHEIDQARKKYLAIHPGIEPYWKRVEEQMNKRHFVENRWGFRWYIFDRLDGLLPEAVAWIPQSTVGILINKIWVNIWENARDIQVLLQVHDSLAGQFPTANKQSCLERMNQLSKITIPYDDPLIIPVGIATSELSWGDCV